jgi:hypothetical protein
MIGTTVIMEKLGMKMDSIQIRVSEMGLVHKNKIVLKMIGITGIGVKRGTQ